MKKRKQEADAQNPIHQAAQQVDAFFREPEKPMNTRKKILIFILTAFVAAALIFSTVYLIDYFFLRTPNRVFTVEELAQYDGSDPNKPIYLAIKGQVFDVTSGKQYYGKGSGYNVFAGRDASRAFVTGCFKNGLTGDLRGFTKEQMESLDIWLDFYQKHATYRFLGTLNLNIDPNSPLPNDNCTHS